MGDLTDYNDNKPTLLLYKFFYAQIITLKSYKTQVIS